MDERIEQTEAIHLGLQIVFKQSIETTHLGVHHDNILCDTLRTEQCTLIGDGNGKIAHLRLTLECLCHLHSTSTISIGLDHTNDACRGAEERTIVVQVVHHGTKVNLKNSFVHLLLKCLGDGIKMKSTGTLDEHHAITQRSKIGTMHKGISVGIERASCRHIVKTLRLCLQFLANTHKHLHSTALDQACHMGIQLIRWSTALQYIAQYQHSRAPLAVGTTVHKVKGYIQTAEVAIVCIVYQCTRMPALLNFQAHCHGFKAREPFLYHILIHAKMAAHPCTKFLVALKGITYGFVSLKHHRAVLEQKHLL